MKIAVIFVSLLTQLIIKMTAVITASLVVLVKGSVGMCSLSGTGDKATCGYLNNCNLFICGGVIC